MTHKPSSLSSTGDVPPRATYLRMLLKALEERFPPARHPDAVADSHHGLTFCRYGSDEAGWTDKLGLHLRLGPKLTQTVFLDDDDLEKSIDETVDAIAAVIQGTEQ